MPGAVFASGGEEAATLGSSDDERLATTFSGTPRVGACEAKMGGDTAEGPLVDARGHQQTGSQFQTGERSTVRSDSTSSSGPGSSTEIKALLASGRLRALTDRDFEFLQSIAQPESQVPVGSSGYLHRPGATTGGSNSLAPLQAWPGGVCICGACCWKES